MMSVRIPKSSTDIGNGPGNPVAQFGGQPGRRFSDSLRQENPNQSFPVKVLNLPAFRAEAISARAESSADVA